MKRISFLVAFAICLSLLAWSASGRAEALPDGSATSLDWDGVYRGVVPCADCEGIATTITLRRDGSYHLEAVYQGRSMAAFDQQGKFGWDPTGGVIALDGLRDRPSRFLVGEGYLLQLDMEGKRIAGLLADRYRLPKLAAPQSPSILFDETGQRIEGYGGCNSFAGAYELKDGGRIAFSGIAATLRACPDMETESQLFEVLGMTDNYAIAGMRLSLHKARMAPLARFEAAPAP
jgi:heat shock protein HslJ